MVMEGWLKEIVEDRYCKNGRRFFEWHTAKESRWELMGKIGKDSDESEGTVEERDYPQSRNWE